MIDLVVIVGPTASGKTRLSIDIAKKCKGEIICADSRTIYKGMDIGTAKPTKKEQLVVPHWGLDLVNPNEYYSVADFKIYAEKKINEIRSRHHIPFLVGGTGLYIDSIIFDYKFGPKVDVKQRLKLQHMSLEDLYGFCKKNSIMLPENNKNKRYIIRAIEVNGINVDNREKLIDNCIVVGISTDKDVLMHRIKKRFDQMLEDGVIYETNELMTQYDFENEAMKSNIYPLIKLYTENKISLIELKEKFIVSDLHLAKRQMTWLKRNKYIHWLTLKDAKKYLFAQLAIYKNS